MLRQPSEEWLDIGQGTAQEIAASMDDLWRINRWLGGVTGSMALLERFVAVTGLSAFRVLDVGAGDSRLMELLRRKMEKRQVHVQFTALDRKLIHLTHADPAQRSRHAVIADALALPFRDQSFDAVMCNLFLHHFSNEKAVRLLTVMKAAARRAVLINDLERSPLAEFFIRHAWLFARSPITRHDGPASVRQAYTRDELHRLAQEVRCRNYEIHNFWACRLGLILWS